MIALLALLAAGAAPSAPAFELRGTWVVRTALATPAQADEAVDDAARAGLNALFVQVRGRGDALYASSIVPRSEVLRGQPADFDPLARVIARARSRGIRVHAWINVLLAGGFGVPLPAGHVAAVHPEWLMVPRTVAASALGAPRSSLAGIIEGARDADVEGFYLSPSSAGAAAHLEAVVRELVARYPVDGLHLDFIRYPGRDYDYSRSALASFGVLLPGRSLLDGPAQDPAGFARHRRRAVDALVARLAKVARRTRPSLTLSAAVVPEEVAMRDKGQEWERWLRDGRIDAACPMAYTPDTELFREQIAGLRARLGPRARLWAGIGAWRLDTDGVVDKVRAAREAGASGVVLFSSDMLLSADLDRLRAGLDGGAAGAHAGAAGSR
jgi:uncharacterized lipoprotein YddW (UPF0748 family)